MSYRTSIFSTGGAAGAADAFHALESTSLAVSSATEAQAQKTMRSDGTLSKLTCYVGANSSGASSILNIRKNGADGNSSITIGAGVTGILSDPTNADTFVSGDLLGYKIARSGSITVSSIFAYKRNIECRSIHSTTGTFSSTNNSTTKFFPISGNPGNTVTESAEISMIADTDLTARNLEIYVVTNARLGSSNARFRKNNANGNQVITIGAGVTGILSDTTNTDSVAVGDIINYSLVTFTGGGALAFRRLGCSLTSPINQHHIVATTVGGTILSPAVTRYFPVAGALAQLSAEDSIAFYPPGYGKISHLRIHVISNAGSSATSFTLMKNGVATAITGSIGTGGTGPFQDTTNEVYYEEGDYFTLRFIRGAGVGNITIGRIQALIESNTEEYQHPIVVYR